MNGDILKETNDWIQQLAQWERRKTTDVWAEQLQQLPVLKCYMEKLLEHHLQSNLDQQQICHLMILMNKLSEMKEFLADRDFALTLAHCLLRLGNPKMTMDAKSKSLALMAGRAMQRHSELEEAHQMAKHIQSKTVQFQLSKAIQPSSVESEVNEYLECIGKSQEDFRQVYVQQALNSIKKHLVLLGNPCKMSSQGKQNTSEEIPLFSTEFLLALARLCLSLRQEVEFSSLLEAILEHLVSYRHSDHQVESLMKEMASFHLSQGNGGDLPYGCLVILWSNYLEILEEEVLNIVRFVTDMITISRESLLQFSENLVKASCEYTEINVAVFSILHQVYIKSEGHPAIGRVIAILSTAIWQRMTHTEVESHVKSFPVCYHALIKLIRNNPFGMKMSTAIVHLSQLVSVIDDLISVSSLETTVSDVSWLLTQFSLWHQAAFFLCYRGDEQVTASCVKLICWCSGLHCISETVLTKLQEVVLSLKALIGKLTLSVHDINFVLASCNLRLGDATDERLKTVVRKFLLTFCLQLNSTAPVVEQIVTLAFGNDNQHLSLLHIADILEVLMENPGSWVEEICIRKSEMMGYMQHIHKILSAETSLQIPDWLSRKITELLNSSSV